MACLLTSNLMGITMANDYSLLSLPQDKKSQLASMENYGRTTGNYAHLTPIAFKDIQNKGYFTNYTFQDVMSNPSLYDAAVAAYWKVGTPVSSVPENVRDLWWLSPAQYQQSGGNIERVKAFGPYKTDEAARTVFRNRARNRALHMKKQQSDQTVKSVGAASSSALSPS